MATPGPHPRTKGTNLMSTLLRDVISIPERVGADDYVLRLTDSTHDEAHLKAALDQYVVTDSLRQNFLASLDLVADALSQNTSRAAYLTGSFGSGKSHFMAILSLLLRSDATARGKPELASVVSKHNGWTQGKKFLVVPYHMINAETLESESWSWLKWLPHSDIPGQIDGVAADIEKWAAVAKRAGLQPN